MDGLSREQAFGLFADLEDTGYRPTLEKERGSYRVSTHLGLRTGAATVGALERLASARGARLMLNGIAVRVDFPPREKEEDAPSEGEGE